MSHHNKVEIYMLDDVGPYRKSQVVTLEEGSFLYALIRGNKAEVLNPPSWELPENADKKPVEEVKDTASALKRALKPVVKEEPKLYPIANLGNEPELEVTDEHTIVKTKFSKSEKSESE